MTSEELFPPPDGPIFKYRAMSSEDARQRLNQVLIDSKIYFASFRDLNDPFEGKVIPNFQSPKELIDEFWKARRERVAGETLESFERLRAQFVTKAHNLDFQRELTNRMLAILESTGVLCLAGTPTSVPMWSYYAGGHTGVCLRFRTDLEFLRWAFDGGIFGKVHYANEYPHVKFYEDSDEIKGRAMLFTKSSDWHHEQEWRVTRNEVNGLVTFPPALLDGVILGAKMSEEDRAYVLELVGRRAVPTELQEARLDTRSFSLTIAPVAST